MGDGADPTTDTDLELLDAARESDLAAVVARHSDDASEHPVGLLAAEDRDAGEPSPGPAVRKEAK